MNRLKCSLTKVRRFFRKGGSEILGFLCIMPVLLFLLAVLVTAVQIGSIKERLEYTAYKACRQVVTVEDSNEDGDYLDDAEDIAREVAEQDFSNSTEMIEPGSVDAEVVLLNNGTVEETRWEKGNYVQCTVSAEVTAPIVFMSGRRSASIVMMLEYPANEGGDYPWFRDL